MIQEITNLTLEKRTKELIRKDRLVKLQDDEQYEGKVLAGEILRNCLFKAKKIVMKHSLTNEERTLEELQNLVDDIQDLIEDISNVKPVYVYNYQSKGPIIASTVYQSILKVFIIMRTGFDPYSSPDRDSDRSDFRRRAT